MDLAEDYVKFCIQYVVENHLEELTFFESEQVHRVEKESKSAPKVKLLANLRNVMNSEFKRLTYEEAIAICIKVYCLFRPLLTI